jgi:hypothetical protein
MSRIRQLPACILLASVAAYALGRGVSAQAVVAIV